MAQRALVGDVHHSKLVPDAGENMLNEKGPITILTGPSWSRDPLSVSLSVLMCPALWSAEGQLWKVFLGSLGGGRRGTKM